jgi:hypothetical protein
VGGATILVWLSQLLTYWEWVCPATTSKGEKQVAGHGRSSGDRAFAHSIIVLIVVYKNHTSPPETMVAYQSPEHAVHILPI